MLTFDKITLAQGDFRLSADLRIGAGVTAVIGPSGGGKSTLLAAVAGFLTPQTGSILWDGRDLSGLVPGARPVSMLFQDNNLFAHLTVAQNVGLGLRHDLRMSGGDEDKVSQALSQVGLAGYETRKPAALSGGQQSRVALARVLVAERPVVLLDEPFAALGPALKDDMLGLVRDVLLPAGKSIVMVTHDPKDAQRIADHVVLVAEGVAAAPMATDVIFSDPPLALRDYLGEALDG